MRISFLVVDDFYDDPHAVRNAALHTDYARMVDGSNYPGDNSAEVFEVDGLNELVSNLVHEPVIGTPGTGHGLFRIAIASAESEARARVHVDGDSYWPGIVYLPLPEHCQGGTEFFRHRELGTDRAPIYDSEAAQYGAQSCFGDRGENARLVHLFFFTLDKSILYGPGPATQSTAAEPVANGALEKTRPPS